MCNCKICKHGILKNENTLVICDLDENAAIYCYHKENNYLSNLLNAKSQCEMYDYKKIDNSDLNELLELATNDKEQKHIAVFCTDCDYFDQEKTDYEIGLSIPDKCLRNPLFNFKYDGVHKCYARCDHKNKNNDCNEFEPKKHILSKHKKHIDKLFNNKPNENIKPPKFQIVDEGYLR